MTNGEQRTALIVVDMQNAFISLASGTAVEGADNVVQAVDAYASKAKAREWPIFYTQDVGPIELPAGDPERQTDLYPGLDVYGIVVSKGPGKTGGFSSFGLATGGPGNGGLSALAGHLHSAGVEAVVIVGLAADVCVAATARDARRLGYNVSLPLHATAFVHTHPNGDEAAVQELRAAGVAIED